MNNAVVQGLRWMRLVSVAGVLSAAVACEQRTAQISGKADTAFHSEGKIRANGIDIAYQIDGPANGIPLVFIVGIAGQMSAGRDKMTQALVNRGFRVLRFDNRDSGKTTHMSAAGAPPEIGIVIEALQADRRPPLAYTLLDMAQDTVALMDALRIKKAHILGGSMGGMIAQTIVSQYPERALSLISVSSTTGNPAISYGPAAAKMTESNAPGRTEEERLDRKVKAFQALEGSRFREDPGKLRETLASEIEGSDARLAAERQSMAIVPYADRRHWLKTIGQPALIIHGSEDPLFPLAHARDQADNLPNAKLEVIEGMGHVMSDEAVPTMVRLIVKHVERTL